MNLTARAHWRINKRNAHVAFAFTCMRTKFIYYILFKYYIKYKSLGTHIHRRFTAPAAKGDASKFYSRWPVRILFSASRLCVYQSSPSCNRRKRDRSCAPANERENPPAIDIWSTAAAVLPGESRYVFSESACTARAHPPRDLLFARGTFHPRWCLPFDLIISFV